MSENSKVCPSRSAKMELDMRSVEAGAFGFVAGEPLLVVVLVSPSGTARATAEIGSLFSVFGAVVGSATSPLSVLLV